MTDKPELTEQVDAEDIEWMCEAAIGLNRAWNRERAEQLRDLALRALSGGVMVPVKPTREMLNAAVDVDPFKLGDISPIGFRCSPQQLFERCYTAMLAAAPASPDGRGGAPSSDIQRAHSIVTAAEQRVGVLQELYGRALDDGLRKSAMCNELNDRAEQLQRQLEESKELNSDTHETLTATRNECVNLKRDLDAANVCIRDANTSVDKLAWRTRNQAVLHAAMDALAHREPAGGEKT